MDAVSGSGGNIAVGALVGYVSSRAMDQATTWFYSVQGDESKRREDELAPGGALVQLGKQLAPALGRDLTDEHAGRVGLAAHRGLGTCYGIGASLPVRRGMRPLVAGPTVAATAWAVVDEGTAISLFTEYPRRATSAGS